LKKFEKNIDKTIYGGYGGSSGGHVANRHLATGSAHPLQRGSHGKLANAGRSGFTAKPKISNKHLNKHLKGYLHVLSPMGWEDSERPKKAGNL
jgi:hypothetical protein